MRGRNAPDFTTRIIPVVVIHGGDNRCTLKNDNRLPFAAMPMPRTTEALRMILYEVEASIVRQIEVVDKQEIAPIVSYTTSDKVITTHKSHFSHCDGVPKSATPPHSKSAGD